MFHYTVETTKTVEEAIASLEESLKEEKFGVLWQFDIKDKLEEKGLEPCKIVVYEDACHSKIGMPRPAALIEMMNDQSSIKDLAIFVH